MAFRSGSLRHIEPLLSGAVNTDDTATCLFSLTPSSVEADVFVDAATEVLALTPSSTEGGPLIDSATENLKLTPSGTDTLAGISATTYLDTDTEYLKLTPSAVIVHGFAEQDTEYLKFTPFPVSLFIFDGSTVSLALSPSANEHYCPQKVEFEGFAESRWSAEERNRWSASETSRWEAVFLGTGEGFAC